MYTQFYIHTHNIISECFVSHLWVRTCVLVHTPPLLVNLCAKLTSYQRILQQLVYVENNHCPITEVYQYWWEKQSNSYPTCTSCQMWPLLSLWFVAIATDTSTAKLRDLYLEVHKTSLLVQKATAGLQSLLWTQTLFLSLHCIYMQTSQA